MPASYSSKEKRAIEEFAQVTQGDKNTAAKLLKQANWSMSAAVNAYVALCYRPSDLSVGRLGSHVYFFETLMHIT